MARSWGHGSCYSYVRSCFQVSNALYYANQGGTLKD